METIKALPAPLTIEDDATDYDLVDGKALAIAERQPALPTPMTREEWLMELAEKLAPRFAAEGFPLPKYRVSVGFPRGSRNAIGQCWTPKVSADAVTEIFISPELDQADVVHVLVHELTHAAVGIPAGHAGDFTKMIRKLGLEGKPTSTVAGPETKWAYDAADTMGRSYPHGVMNVFSGIGGIVPFPGGPVSPGPLTPTPKQKTRLLKASCPGCGYVARITAKWLATGLPVCPCGETWEAEGF